MVVPTELMKLFIIIVNFKVTYNLLVWQGLQKKTFWKGECIVNLPDYLNAEMEQDCVNITMGIIKNQSGTCVRRHLMLACSLHLLEKVKCCIYCHPMPIFSIYILTISFPVFDKVIIR